jgi:hypothetical protein
LGTLVLHFKMWSTPSPSLALSSHAHLWASGQFTLDCCHVLICDVSSGWSASPYPGHFINAYSSFQVFLSQSSHPNYIHVLQCWYIFCAWYLPVNVFFTWSNFWKIGHVCLPSLEKVGMYSIIVFVELMSEWMINKQSVAVVQWKS